MNSLLKLIVTLQDIDARILEKSRFIERVPMRVGEVDGPLKQATLELERLKQKNDALLKKKRDRERVLEDVQEKIKKMKARVSEIKTNKEFQAYQKEILVFEKEVSDVEDQILQIMEDADSSLREQSEREKAVSAEQEKVNAFKRELDAEVGHLKAELLTLKQERAAVVAQIPPDFYKMYFRLLESGSGVAVTTVRSEICQGCNMHVPPQLFVEIKKGEEIFQCPQCRRILYHTDEALPPAAC